MERDAASTLDALRSRVRNYVADRSFTSPAFHGRTDKHGRMQVRLLLGTEWKTALLPEARDAWPELVGAWASEAAGAQASALQTLCVAIGLNVAAEAQGGDAATPSPAAATPSAADPAADPAPSPAAAAPSAVDAAFAGVDDAPAAAAAAAAAAASSSPSSASSASASADDAPHSRDRLVPDGWPRVKAGRLHDATRRASCEGADRERRDLLIDARSVGAIVGVRGTRLAAIGEVSGGCQLYVMGDEAPPGCPASKRLLALIGTPTQLGDAMVEVAKVLARQGDSLWTAAEVGEWRRSRRADGDGSGPGGAMDGGATGDGATGGGAGGGVGGGAGGVGPDCTAVELAEMGSHDFAAVLRGLHQLSAAQSADEIRSALHLAEPFAPDTLPTLSAALCDAHHRLAALDPSHAIPPAYAPQAAAPVGGAAGGAVGRGEGAARGHAASGNAATRGTGTGGGGGGGGDGGVSDRESETHGAPSAVAQAHTPLQTGARDFAAAMRSLHGLNDSETVSRIRAIEEASARGAATIAPGGGAPPAPSPRSARAAARGARACAVSSSASSSDAAATRARAAGVARARKRG